MANALLRIAIVCGVLIAGLWIFVPGSLYTGTALIVLAGLIRALIIRKRP